MNDNLIQCPLSGGNACYFVENEGHKAWFSYSCGYATDSTKLLGSKTQEEFEEVLPNLYKDLRWVNPADNLVWYPVSHNVHGKGIVYADGTSIEDWKWTAAKSIRLTEMEKASGKYPKGSEHKIDMSTTKQFDKLDFIEALDYIGEFNNG